MSLHTHTHTHTPGYMLEPDIDKRPNIWQVTEAVSRILKLKNPVKNVFHSHPPPSLLPTAPRSHSNKTTPPKTTVAKATTSKEKVKASSSQHLSVSPSLSARSALSHSHSADRYWPISKCCINYCCVSIYFYVTSS